MLIHQRHDISDRVWANIEKLLPGSEGSVGRPSADNRLFINAVFWILRTGSPWRDLPPDLVDWKNIHRRFCRCVIGEFGRRYSKRSLPLQILHGVLLMQATARYILMPQAPWAAMKTWLHKRRLNTKIHLAVDAHGMPVRIIVTGGTRADCKEACALIDGLISGAPLADRGYDTESIIRKAGESYCQSAIPPRKSRKILCGYDRELYESRHLVENAFLHLKRWRSIATRYAKRSASFLAAV